MPSSNLQYLNEHQSDTHDPPPSYFEALNLLAEAQRQQQEQQQWASLMGLFGGGHSSGGGSSGGRRVYYSRSSGGRSSGSSGASAAAAKAAAVLAAKKAAYDTAINQMLADQKTLLGTYDGNVTDVNKLAGSATDRINAAGQDMQGYIARANQGAVNDMNGYTQARQAQLAQYQQGNQSASAGTLADLQRQGIDVRGLQAQLAAQTQFGSQALSSQGIYQQQLQRMFMQSLQGRSADAAEITAGGLGGLQQSQMAALAAIARARAAAQASSDQGIEQTRLQKAALG